METINITKKKLIESARFQTFTGHRVKINVMWFDWQSGDYTENGITKSFCGSKYMVAMMGSKKDLINKMYHWLTSDFAAYDQNTQFWMASEDKHRRKMPLSFNWFSNIK